VSDLQLGLSLANLILFSASVPFEILEKAFGSASLGILIVKDLPVRFLELRLKLLSYASYLANLPTEELGKGPFRCLHCMVISAQFLLKERFYTHLP